jgi:bacterioferritin-associated ferredoxin
VYVCICHGVTDAQIAATGASTVSEVGDRTGAGTGCGMCQYKIEDVLTTCARECAMARPLSATAR